MRADAAQLSRIDRVTSTARYDAALTCRPDHSMGAGHVFKAMTVNFPPEVSKMLKMIATQDKTILQTLIGEGIDMLPVQRGQRPFGAR